MESYRTQKTCSKQIIYEVKDNKLTSLKFVHGCSGNTQGLSKLAVGMDIDEIIARLDGIICRNGTSCPDQLAQALKEYKKNHPAG